MPDYRRNRINGGTYFFTVKTADCVPIFQNEQARRILRRSFIETRRRFPFENWAVVLLPNHLHCIWMLPSDDADYSRRWSMIKRLFSKEWLGSGASGVEISESRRRHRELGVWQRRFWEHTIRNDEELYVYRDYIHLNPVMHGYVNDPLEWAWSSVHRHLKMGWLEPGWTGATPLAIDPRADV